jgi:hypothetical protein
MLVTGSAEAGLVVRQRSSRSADEATPQVLYIGERALRIDDLASGRYTVVLLDREKVYEIDPRLQEYTEQGFDYFRREREKAAEEREAARKAITDGRFTPEERAKKLAERHLREDGKEVVTVERAPGDLLKGHHTRRTSILVNGDPAIVVYTTDEIREYAPPKLLFEFYEKSGLFAEDVVAELKKVEGFPLRLYTHVDFYDTGAKIQTDVDEWGDWPEEPGKFQIPASYQKVERFTPPREAGQALACAVCGKALRPAEAIRVPGDGAYVCSQAHQVEYLTHKSKYKK